ncbi:hypothetical protein [Pantoea sp. Tr-811]|uniref:DUF6916 family protein n=1 Tax=Pantoea sp. Tr-811 TaxID=2608361 RepID=UPI0019622F14|nr:hypothetical protein [Pantoea sp. Tr-811]
MSETIDYTMPTYTELERVPADAFSLQVGPQQHIQVTRVALRTEVAMSADYECYAIVFALPEGVQLPQAMFRVSAPEGQQWTLMMTPVKPEEDGCHALEAVIHRKRMAA